MDYQLIFRSRYGQFSAVAVLVLALLFITMIWATDGPADALKSLVLPAGLVYFTWWIWAWPHVAADRRGITIYNQLRTYRISWDSFSSAEARFGLYLHVHGDEPAKRIYAAGVPARGGFTASRLKQPTIVPTLDFSRGPKVTVRTEPHTAAQLLEEEKIYDTKPKRRPESYRPPRGQGQELEPTNPVGDAPRYVGVTVSTNWLLIGLLVVAAAGVVLYGVAL